MTRLLHRRKRTLLMLLLLLTYSGGGAIINVAVAWGLVWCMDSQTMQDVSVEIDDDIRDWSVPVPGDWPAPHYGEIGDHFGILNESLGAERVPDDPDMPLDSFSSQRVDAGWPARSLRAFECMIEGAHGFACTSTAYERGISFDQLQSPSSQPRFLPLVPLWPGFVINTVFYAAILWLLVAAPGFVRRRIRIRRKQCPACAYPIGTSDVCTECGKPLPRQPASPAMDKSA